MSFEICDSGHEEIVYSCNILKNKCPLCKANELNFELSSKIDELQNLIDDLEKEE